MHQILNQYCPTCNAVRDIYSATVGPASPEGYHDVAEYELECGHSIEPEEDVQMDTETIDLLRTVNPDVIEITQ